MIHPACPRLRRLSSVLICLFWIVVSVHEPRTRADVAPDTSKLFKHDRTRLIEAFAQNKPNVMLILAARQGMNSSLVAEIGRCQGTVYYRDDDVDYVRGHC